MAKPQQTWARTPLPLVFLLLLLPAVAEPQLPRLTGRVVDNANMIDSTAEARISNLLAGHENATSNQIAVVTLPDLQGYTIETFGYQLGRYWALGQKAGKEKDNGVLLLVAKKERKVRIEVGYGLEGTLTDAIASNIINSIILPNFKRGQFSEGIETGATAIVQALGGQYQMRQPRRSERPRWLPLLFLGFFGLMWVSSFFNSTGGGVGRRGIFYGGGFSGRGGFGGGGFSGGGGGFGGGGASGGW